MTFKMHPVYNLPHWALPLSVYMTRFSHYELTVITNSPILDIKPRPPVHRVLGDMESMFPLFLFHLKNFCCSFLDAPRPPDNFCKPDS